MVERGGGMKKDIEWLKKKIGTEMMYLEPNRADKWSDERYKTLRSNAKKLDKLDEPEEEIISILERQLFDEEEIEYVIDNIN